MAARFLGGFVIWVDSRFLLLNNLFKESSLGNFITDIISTGIKCDGVILNSGEFRSNRIHQAGPFTYKDMFAILPMMDSLVVFQMTGQFSKRELTSRSTAYPHFSRREATLRSTNDTSIQQTDNTSAVNEASARSSEDNVTAGVHIRSNRYISETIIIFICRQHEEEEGKLRMNLAEEKAKQKEEERKSRLMLEEERKSRLMLEEVERKWRMKLEEEDRRIRREVGIRKMELNEASARSSEDNVTAGVHIRSYRYISGTIIIFIVGNSC
ncbi:hypothetical protein HELRODRAFT_166870 [Helobdella robusta]|uniref:5'-Nucleotidase C-terminal domain-containing protein n=1 Tax=Helobdella robusta TaxID=6412 RepID=T1EYN8_HELRO|nr:hypothetical protein HELRODRAFT_166870 [Helobdella robusta]ESO11818.1 hypothetical protein HELRODRAFT_166870 [Helobdella robusta]